MDGAGWRKKNESSSSRDVEAAKIIRCENELLAALLGVPRDDSLTNR